MDFQIDNPKIRIQNKMFGASPGKFILALFNPFNVPLLRLKTFLPFRILPVNYLARLLG